MLQKHFCTVHLIKLSYSLEKILAFNIKISQIQNVDSAERSQHKTPQLLVYKIGDFVNVFFGVQMSSPIVNRFVISIVQKSVLKSVLVNINQDMNVKSQEIRWNSTKK